VVIRKKECTFQSRGRNKEIYIAMQPMDDNPMSDIMVISFVNEETETLTSLDKRFSIIFPQARQIRLI
jgi:hypothetical protein